MIFFDATDRPFVIDGPGFRLVSPCCEAPTRAESPLVGVWAREAATVRPDGLYAVCTACLDYCTDPGADRPWLATDTPDAHPADVADALRYNDMENSR